MIKDPKVLIGRIKGIFITICLLLLTYLFITQSMDYLENKDSSSISYKRFNQGPLDEYPTFSFCLKGSELYWKHEKMLYTKLETTSSQYIQILKGNGVKHEYNQTSELYENVPMKIVNTSTAIFHDVSLNPLDVISEVDFVTQQANNTAHYGNGSEGGELLHVPFYVGYQAPDEVCFTRKSSLEFELIRIRDMISLKRSLLSPGNHLHLDFSIVIHYPGQLLKSVKTPAFKSSLSSYMKSKVLELKVSHVTTLRKRKDSNIPCNEKIKNDDLLILKKIVEYIGCIPVYWQLLVPTHNNLDNCYTSLQMKNANQYIEHLEKVMSSYDPPCVEMTSVVKMTRDLEQRDEHFRIIIQYVQSFYQEIQIKVAYTFEFFFSSLGGFIGICVGTSMMEIPNVLEYIAMNVHKKKDIAVIGK